MTENWPRYGMREVLETLATAGSESNGGWHVIGAHVCVALDMFLSALHSLSKLCTKISEERLET